MPDIKECSIRAPHEAHGWVAHRVDRMGEYPVYHHCGGKQWTNNEVYNDLQYLIKMALENPPGWASDQLSPDAQIMQEIWPKVVGFLQPEDMPMKMSVGPDTAGWSYKPGALMVMPDHQERIADALEKIERHMRPAPPSAYDPKDF